MHRITQRIPYTSTKAFVAPVVELPVGMKNISMGPPDKRQRDKDIFW